jgi:hypothetical protein
MSHPKLESGGLKQEEIRRLEVIEPMEENLLLQEREMIYEKLVASSIQIISEYVKEDQKNVEPPKVNTV